MQPDTKNPDQQLDQIKDLPAAGTSDTSSVADEVKGGDGSTTVWTTSNIMKTKHDTVKNSISNVR